MMKYIRTEDKIYETKDFALVEDKRFGRMYVNKYDFPFIPKNESDTIEELCDCFVYGKCDYMELEEAQQEKEWYEQNLQQGEQPIYGAIWTDKGLIYVARMNKERKWELL